VPVCTCVCVVHQFALFSITTCDCDNPFSHSFIAITLVLEVVVVASTRLCYFLSLAHSSVSPSK